MPIDDIRVGVDIGGSHITAARVRIQSSGDLVVEAEARGSVDSSADASAETILEQWASVICRVVTSGVRRVGIAIPGPFDYATGVSLLSHKYPTLLGVNVKERLASALGSDIEIAMLNDAEAFLLGEVLRPSRIRRGRDVIAVTLGTGLGSAWYCGTSESLVAHEPLYSMIYKGKQAEEWFCGSSNISVRDLAEDARRGDVGALQYFAELGSRLGDFLRFVIGTGTGSSTELPLVVVGGSVARAWSLFGRQAAIRLDGVAEIEPTVLFEKAAVLGAAREAAPWRESGQKLMPLYKPVPSPGLEYDLYPSHPCPSSGSGSGWDGLAQLISAALKERRSVAVDGAPGHMWDTVMRRLAEHGVMSSSSARAGPMLPESVIDDLVAPYLGGDDPLFGTQCDLQLSDFFDFSAGKSKGSGGGGAGGGAGTMNAVVCGPGAALVLAQAQAQAEVEAEAEAESKPTKPLVLFIDLPKNEEQYRSRAGTGAASNLGRARVRALPAKEHYKRSYFVDWPVMRRHMAAIFPVLDYIVDGQRPDEPVWVSGAAMRETMLRLSCSGTGLRVRPWFEPGPWGGQWLAQKLPHLPPAPNYAWSFELIAPENGLILECECGLAEVSFDWLLLSETCAVNLLGARGFERFGHQFPIRFNYLDTVGGGNLSVQVHPSRQSIAEFGETFTQDESYYVVDVEFGANPSPCVYLGLKSSDEDRLAEFKAALESAQELDVGIGIGIGIDIGQFVQRFSSSKGDYFCIPHGTVHSSGKGNVVLEISATPYVVYIFTYKMFDWKRLPARPLNIDRAFADIIPERDGSALRVVPVPVATGIELLPTVDLPYDVKRVTLKRGAAPLALECGGSVQVLNVVDGDAVRVCGQLRAPHETFVVPAAAGFYTMECAGVRSVVVIAQLKE